MVIASAMACSGGGSVGGALGGEAAQQRPVDLVGARERHAVEKKYAARMPVRRTVRERIGLDLVFRRSGTRAQHDECIGHLAF
jgi:hypothetical protein